MNREAHHSPRPTVRELLHARPDVVGPWLRGGRLSTLGWCVLCITLGAGLYGAALGAWRSPLQGLYSGLKLPLVILMTTRGNALLNGMLAPLLGLSFTFRQSFLAVLFSFTITAILLGGFSPLAAFVVWNTPALTEATTLHSAEYGFLQLTIAALIAVAGVTGVLKMLPWLLRWSSNRDASLRVLFAWLSVNLLLGSQVCWVLRPFLWDPAGPEEFIGREYFRGSFFETLFEAARRLATGH